MFKLGHQPYKKVQKRPAKAPDPSRTAQVDKIASTAPEQAKKAYLAVIAGGSRVAAMKVMCWHCCGWERKQVGQCSAKGCPLWAWRPYQQEATDAP